MTENGMNKGKAGSVVIAAAPTVRQALSERLQEAGLAPVFIEWSDEPPDAAVFPHGTRALVVSALHLKRRTKNLAGLLLAFPRRAAEAAKEAGVERIIYAVPEVRGLTDKTGAALRSSVVMMQHSFKALVLRCGFLLGAGGIVEGMGAGPALVVPGQGWSETSPLSAEDLTHALVSLIEDARDDTTEEGKEPSNSYGLASSREAVPLADLVELLRGGLMRLHVPVSLIKLGQVFTGASLEERALFGGGSLKVEANDLEKLTGRAPASLSDFARGKKPPKWLPYLEASQ